MKAIIRLKGGPGSGHHGHAGRPGERGGSAPGAGGISAERFGLGILRDIVADDRLLGLATGLMADGHVDDVQNVFDHVDDAVNAVAGREGEQRRSLVSDIVRESDPEMSEGEIYVDPKIAPKIASLADTLYENYERATGEKGYYVKDEKNISKDREAWERKYYGKVVGGYSAGETYASGELKKYVTEKLRGRTVIEPKKTSRAREGGKPQRQAGKVSRAPGDVKGKIVERPGGIYQVVGSTPGKPDMVRIVSLTSVALEELDVPLEEVL